MESGSCCCTQGRRDEVLWLPRATGTYGRTPRRNSPPFFPPPAVSDLVCRKSASSHYAGITIWQRAHLLPLVSWIFFFPLCTRCMSDALADAKRQRQSQTPDAPPTPCSQACCMEVELAARATQS